MKSLAKFKGVIHNGGYYYAGEFMRAMCEELGIQPPKLLIGISVWGSFYDAQQDLLVLCPLQLDMLKFHPFIALAHELKHKQQYQSGRLANDHQKLANVWDGKDYPLKDNLPHHELPWEIDAMTFEKEVADYLGLSDACSRELKTA